MTRRGGLIALGLIAVVLLFPLAFIVSLPTTFGCRALIDGSPEAKLVYPSGRLLSYESREGSRPLIEMSSPQLPGFTAFMAITSDDHGEFRWFEEQLQSLGWTPLNPEARLQVIQSSGETTRGDAEAIALVRFEAGRIPAGMNARPPEGQALLMYNYVVTNSVAIPGCR